MKIRTCIFILLSTFFISCSKSSNTASGDQIILEAITTKGGFAQITYLDETGAQTILGNVAGNWTISFKSTVRPRQLAITAVSDVITFPSPNITLNIYLNGTLVKSSVGNMILYNLN